MIGREPELPVQRVVSPVGRFPLLCRHDEIAAQQGGPARCRNPGPTILPVGKGIFILYHAPIHEKLYAHPGRAAGRAGKKRETPDIVGEKIVRVPANDLFVKERNVVEILDGPQHRRIESGLPKELPVVGNVDASMNKRLF